MMARTRQTLPHAMCNEDTAPLLVSWSIALAAGAAWLALVYLTPARIVQIPLPTEAPRPFTIDAGFDVAPRTTSEDGVAPSTAPKVVRQHPSASPLNIAGIFTAAMAAHAIAEMRHVMPGAQLVQASRDPSGSHSAKSALASGESSGATPGMTKLGGDGTNANAGVGRIAQGGAIDRATYRAHALPVVSAPVLDGAVADATVLGGFVRGRVAQLQSCYELAGGTDLAGVVALRISIGEGGAVQSAEIVRRTWSGPGAEAAESCLLHIVRGWRVPGGSAGATVTLPISFTRGT
jgi:hypothetical protein